MSFVENAYYQLIGVRKEFPELNPVAAALMELSSGLQIRKHHCIVEGYPLPREGAAIVTGNHYKKTDPYEACIAGREAGRLIRTVVKMILLEKGAYESEEYLKSIGDKSDPAEYNALRAFVLKGIGSIGILRDHPGIRFTRVAQQVLDTNQLLGMFLQGTRDEEGLLRNLEPGVAYLASKKKNRDIPVVPIAFSENKATTLEPVTYNQLKDQLGRDIKIPEFTVILADRIAAALPQRVLADWQNRRDEEYARLAA